MISSSPESPMLDDFDFDNVEAFETLLEETDAAEARRTTWETDNYSALVDIERKLDEAFATGSAPTTALSTPQKDDPVSTMVRRTSVRLSVKDLNLPASSTTAAANEAVAATLSPDTTTFNLTSTLSRRNFLRSVLLPGFTASGALTPGKRLRAVAQELIRKNEGAPPTSPGNASLTQAARSIRDPTRFVDFVMDRLVRVSNSSQGGSQSLASSQDVAVVELVDVASKEVSKLIPVLANYCKVHSALVLKHLLQRKALVESLTALEQRFGAADHRVSNAIGHLLMLVVRDEPSAFLPAHVSGLVRVDLEQRKQASLLESGGAMQTEPPNDKLLASTAKRSNTSDDDRAHDGTRAGDGMQDTSAYASPTVLPPEATAAGLFSGTTTMTTTLTSMQHQSRLLRVEWIPTLLALLCAARPTVFLSGGFMDVAQELLTSTLEPLEAQSSNDLSESSRMPPPDDAHVSAQQQRLISPMVNKALSVPLLAVSSELATVTYVVSTISNAFATASDPEKGGDDSEAPEDEKTLAEAQNVAASVPSLMGIIKGTSHLLASITAVYAGGNRELRAAVSHLGVGATRSIPTWEAIVPAILSGHNTPLSITDCDLDSKEGVALSCCLSLASSLTAVLDCFDDVQRDEAIDLFEEKGSLVEASMFQLLGLRVLSVHLGAAASTDLASRQGKVKQEIRREMHASVRTLMAMPLVAEALKYMERADACSVMTFLSEGFCGAIKQHLKAPTSEATSEVAPYVLGLERCSASLIALELPTVVQQVKETLKRAVADISSMPAARVDPAIGLRDASLHVTRAVSILRTLFSASHKNLHPEDLVAVELRSDDIVWALQWVDALQCPGCCALQAGHSKHDAFTMYHARAVSLLLVACTGATHPTMVRATASLLSLEGRSPCAVLADACIALTQSESSIMSFSSASPSTSLMLDLLSRFATLPLSSAALYVKQFSGTSIVQMLDALAAAENGTDKVLICRTMHAMVSGPIALDDAAVATEDDTELHAERLRDVAGGPDPHRRDANSDGIDSVKRVQDELMSDGCSVLLIASTLSHILNQLHSCSMWQPPSNEVLLLSKLTSACTRKIVAGIKEALAESAMESIGLLLGTLLGAASQAEQASWLTSLFGSLEDVLRMSPDDVALRLGPIVVLLARLGPSKLTLDMVHGSTTALNVLLEATSVVPYAVGVDITELSEALVRLRDSGSNNNAETPPSPQLPRSSEDGAARRSLGSGRMSDDTDTAATPLHAPHDLADAAGNDQAHDGRESSRNSEHQVAVSPSMGPFDESPRSAFAAIHLDEGSEGGLGNSGKGGSTTRLPAAIAAGGRRRSKLFDTQNPQKLVDDLEAVAKSLALKKYQLSEVSTALKVAEKDLKHVRSALERDSDHLARVSECIMDVDPDKFFSRDEVRRRQKVGDKSIALNDHPLSERGPKDPPTFDVIAAGLAAKKSLDMLTDQFHRAMAAAVDTNDRGKLREAAATLILERQLFEKEKAFYTKELEIGAEIIWRKHTQIYDLQLEVDSLSRDSENYKHLQTDFRDLEKTCAHLKSMLDQHNLRLTAPTEQRRETAHRRRSSNSVSVGRLDASQDSIRVVSPPLSAKRKPNSPSSSPTADAYEDDSFDVDDDDSPSNDNSTIIRDSGMSGSSTHKKRPSTAQASRRPPTNPKLETTAQQQSVSGDRAEGADGKEGKSNGNAWSEKMKLEFGLKSANTRIQRLQQEINKLKVERNSAILEAVDARQKTKFVELMHKSDVHGMAWAEQRLRRLEREKDAYAAETVQAHDALKNVLQESKEQIQSVQEQLQRVESDRAKVVTTLALELDTARLRITELSGDNRRKDMMITQLTNKLELLRGAQGDPSAASPRMARMDRTINSEPRPSTATLGKPSGESSQRLAASTSMSMSTSKQNALGKSHRDEPAPDVVVDKRLDPHLQNFFAWKDMQRQRRMKQR